MKPEQINISEEKVSYVTENVEQKNKKIHLG